MTQVPNYTVEDSNGIDFIAQLNDLFGAVRDQNSGTSAPLSPVAFMLWRDTSVTPAVLRVRNAANTAWVTLLADMGITATPEQISDAPAAYRGMLFGLGLANNATDPNNDIDIAAGAAASDDAAPKVMSLAALMTKRLDAAWAAGSGNGGLDTGTKAINTWYYLWLIRNPTSGIVDVLFSASATSPTMPSGYNQKRRIPGGVRTDASGNITSFRMSGRRVSWSATPALAFNSSALGTTAQTFTPLVPTAFKTRVEYRAQAVIGASLAAVMLTDPDVNDELPDASAFPLGSFIAPSGFTNTVTGYCLTSSTGTLRIRSSLASTTVRLTVTAWEDYLA